MAEQGLMARKSVADIIASGDAEAHQLSRTLGPFSITALGIGAIIGAGIFVLTGTAAARFAGPAIMLSFVLGGIVCAFVGLCYSELAAMLPVSGSTYTYTYATLGELFGWIIGWDLILEYAMGAATVAVGWSGYATSLLRNIGIEFPPGSGIGARHRHQAAGRKHRHRHPQPARGLHRRRPNHDARAWHEGIRPAQQHHGGHQAPRRRGLHHPRRDVREPGPLAPVHPRQHRLLRKLRPQRDPTRVLGRLLRVHRLRRGVHVSAGGETAAARHAHRHSGDRSSSPRCCISRWRLC